MPGSAVVRGGFGLEGGVAVRGCDMFGGRMEVQWHLWRENCSY